MTGRWHPRITVAGVITDGEGRYLLVEESHGGGLLLNQPAGHWERGESVVQAVCREVREETGWPFAPTHLVGIYRWDAPDGLTFLRFAFAGTVDTQAPRGPLDAPIVATHWLSAEQIAAQGARMRSPLVLRCVEDHRGGRALPLEALVDLVHPDQPAG